jgi:hypothetical protein
MKRGGGIMKRLIAFILTASLLLTRALAEPAEISQ